MLTRILFLTPLFIMFALTTTTASAKLTAEEIKRLGTELTPLGGEKSGNQSGTIPPWTGGIKQPPENYAPGSHHPDPYPEDQPKIVINKDNLNQYKHQLTTGHQELLKLYPSFHLNLYPSRRSAAYPEWIYEATKKTAATAELADQGNGVINAVNGIPFPIPKTGIEVIWNHLLRFRGLIAERNIHQAALTRKGDYTLVKFEEEFNLLYSHPNITEEQLNNKILLFKQTVTAPPRLAGNVLLVHETLNQIKEPRSAWLYNPGQRRVRRAPHVGYDNPGTASDGVRTNDQFDMFNGAPDRYKWQLIGKKELIVPYNSYKLHSSDLSYQEILTPLHVNPKHLRYELHRVWIVEATLLEGARHLYKRRTFYIDEDSWQILAVDIYDNRDQLWRISEAHCINYYDVPTFWSTLEVHTDLKSGRYLAIGLDNESSMYNFNINRTLTDYSPGALRRAGKR